MKTLTKLRAMAFCASLSMGILGMPHANAVVFHNSDLDIYYQQNTFPGGLDEQQVFLDATTSPSTSITGNVGSQNGLPEVLITTDIAATAANGFAQVKGGDIFHSLTFEIPGFTFGDLMFKTQGLRGPGKQNDISIAAFLGNTLLGSTSLTGLGNGLQAWLLLALNDSAIDKVVLTSDQGFRRISQIHVSDLSAVPIPASLPLFLTGLGLLAVLRNRRNRLEKRST